jgi:tetratricopeptide (TPR) repeat protein
MTSEVTRQAPEYSDLREKHVAVKGLVPGSVLEYQVHDQVFSPLIPGQFWLAYDFTKTEIVLDEELQVSVPKNRPLKMKSADVQPASVVQGDRRIYTWKSSNLEHKEQPPHQLGDFPPPEVLLSTFQTWDEVGRWWLGLGKPQMAATPDIRAKAAELTKGLATEEAKLRAIYEYVAKDFHYIGVSFGIGRYQPHAASVVLSNSYGDCKDKHTLLASLLQAAGIEAWPALINSSRRIDPDVPSPGQFDHMITVVPQEGKLQWMDTTSELAPLGLLVVPLRGKEALVVPDGQLPHLAMTPAEPAQADTSTFDFEGTLTDDGALTAKVRLTETGDGALATRLAFRRVSQSQWKDLAQKVSYFFGFGGTVSNVSASSPGDLDHPFNISYDYSRKQIGDWENHRMTAPLPPIALPGVSEEKEKASFPIILGVPSRADYQCTVEVPKGYSVTLPGAVDLVKPYAEYHSKYSFKDGTLSAERHIVVKVTQIPAAQRDDYRAFQKAVSDDANQYIVFNTGTETAGGNPGSPAFQKAMQDVQSAWIRQDYRAALDAARHALELDPKSVPALRAAAQLHMLLGDDDEAVKTLRKAVIVDPADSDSYMMLTATLMAARRREEGEQVMRDYLKRDPQNETTRMELAQALMTDKKYLDAAAVYEDGIKLEPDNTDYVTDQGWAYAKAGDRDKALAALEKAMEIDSSPVILNNVASALAENNLDLPKAEHFARMAVQMGESNASRTKLDHLRDEDLTATLSLFHYWDTLGWVYFREGKLAEARKYLEASWALSQNAVNADQLGQVEEKLGDKQAAIRYFALSLAANTVTTYKVGVHTLEAHSSPYRKETQERLARLVGASRVDSLVAHWRNELSTQRTYWFDRGSLKPGVGEFFVLIGPGGRAQGAKFVTGSEDLLPAVRSLETIRYNQPSPNDGPTFTLRRGVLYCGKETPKCNFVLLTPDTVSSVK